MRMFFRLIMLAPLAVISTAILAQDEDAKPYIYATYFYCSVNTQEDADKIVKEVDAPIMDKAVKDGLIGGWGWLAHHTGGKWRRIQYFTAPTIDGLLAAQTALSDAEDKADPTANERFGAACPGHDDYIWQAEAGNATDGSRGKAAMSTYWECDVAREDRADEIVNSVLAGVYNSHVGKGQLISWGWSSHVIGGKYRRLGTMTAATYTDLLAARASILEALFGDKPNPEAEEFSDICGSHADYLWDIQIETP